MTETTPGYGLRVVLLRLLTRPDVGALNGQKNVALVVDDGVHKNVVQDATKECAYDLSGKGCSRREFSVCELKSFQLAWLGIHLGGEVRVH